MADYSITIPPNAVLRKAVRTALAQDSEVSFSEGSITNLMESEGTTETIMAYVFSVPTAAVLVAAFKYLSPVLTEYVKNKYVYIKVGDTEIKVASPEDLAAAKSAAVALAKAQQGKK